MAFADQFGGFEIHILKVGKFARKLTITFLNFTMLNWVFLKVQC